MSEDLHDIDKLFQSAIEEHTEAPSASVWDTIDKNLDKNNVTAIKKKYTYLKRLSLLLILLLSGTIVYLMQEKRGNNTTNELPKTISTAASKNNTNNNLTVDERSNENTITAKENTTKEIVNTTDIVKNNTNQQITKSNPITNNKEIAVNSKKENSNEIKNNNKKTGENNPSIVFQKSNKVVKKYKQKIKAIITNGSVEEIALTDEDNSVTNGSNETRDIAVQTLLNTPVEKIITAAQRSEISTLKVNEKPTYNFSGLKSNVAATTKKLKNKPSHRFAATLFYSPEISYGRVEKDEKHHDRYGYDEDADDIKGSENYHHSYIFGALFTLPVSSKWSIQSGVSYFSKSLTIEPKKVYAKPEYYHGDIKYCLNFSSGYAYISPKAGTSLNIGDSTFVSESHQTLQYLQIPLAFNYNFSYKKFTFIPTIGASANFLVKQKVVTESEDMNSFSKQTINKIAGLKSTVFSGYTALGVDYNLNQRVAVSLIPTINFALSSFTKDTWVKSYQNSFGVSGGIKIKF